MYLLDLVRIGTGFRRHFRALPALDDALRDAVYALRHTVYCEELGFEPLREDRRERDAFDAHSVHCLLQEVHTGSFTGCVRLVLGELNGVHELPLESGFRDVLAPHPLAPARFARADVAEVSRLAILGQWRRRASERKQPCGDSDFSQLEHDLAGAHPPRRVFPYLSAGLYLGALAQAEQHQIEHLYMLGEERLARQLRALGVELTRIGPEREHRGTRYPAHLSVPDTIRHLHPLVRQLFEVIAGEIEVAYACAERVPESLSPFDGESQSGVAGGIG